MNTTTIIRPRPTAADKIRAEVAFRQALQAARQQGKAA